MCDRREVREAELDTLSVDDIVALTSAVRDVAGARETMAQAAQAITDHLREALVLRDGSSACALVRLYTTLRGGFLPDGLEQAPAPEDGRLRPYLTLVGTSGTRPAWNDRRLSASHAVIPLDRADILVDRAPMIAGLLSELGVDIDAFVDLEDSDAGLIQHQEYGIFHVECAEGSPLIPAQDFVTEHRIRSVIGCGGGLPSGEVFVLVLFALVDVDARTSELFRTLAFGIKAALVPYTFKVLTAR